MATKHSRHSTRTFTLSDGLVLIAAAAVGWAVFVAAVREAGGGRFVVRYVWTAPTSGWNAPEELGRVSGIVLLLLPCVGAWTLVLPGLRSQPPRPRRRAWRRPGMTACIAASAGMSTWAVVAGATWLLWASGKGVNRVPAPIWLGRMAIDHLIAYAGTAVAGAWAVQAVTGRWRHAADWVEWLGLSLGVFWIAAGLVWGIRLSWVLF